MSGLANECILSSQFRDAIIRAIFGFNPWKEEGAASTVSSQKSAITTISSNKVAPA